MPMSSELRIKWSIEFRCRKFPSEDYSRTSLRPPRTAFTVKTVKWWEPFSPVWKREILTKLMLACLEMFFWNVNDRVRKWNTDTHKKYKPQVLTFVLSEVGDGRKEDLRSSTHELYKIHLIFFNERAWSNVTSSKGGYQFIYLTVMAYWVRLLHYYIRMPQRYLQMDKITSFGPHARQI